MTVTSARKPELPLPSQTGACGRRKASNKRRKENARLEGRSWRANHHSYAPTTQERRNDEWRAQARQRGSLGRAPQMLNEAPDTFYKRPRSGKLVVRILRKLLGQPPTDHSQFEVAPADGDFVVGIDPQSDSAAIRSTLRGLFRICDGFRDPEKRLENAIQNYHLAGPELKIRSKSARSHGSFKSPEHLGFWAGRGFAGIRITSETVGQNAAVEEAQREMFNALNDIVCTRAMALLKSHCPLNAHEREHILQQAYAAVADDLQLRPELRQTAWICIAVKFGAADFAHLDFGDHIDHFSIIGAVGDFQGAEMVFPQLRLRVPLRPGQLLFVRTRYLAHYVTKFVGVRYVFVGFMCHNVVQYFKDGFQDTGFAKDTEIESPPQ